MLLDLRQKCLKKLTSRSVQSIHPSGKSVIVKAQVQVRSRSELKDLDLGYTLKRVLIIAKITIKMKLQKTLMSTFLTQSILRKLMITQIHASFFICLNRKFIKVMSPKSTCVFTKSWNPKLLKISWTLVSQDAPQVVSNDLKIKFAED